MTTATPVDTPAGIEWAAARIARDLRPGSVINLGIGAPGRVAKHLDPADEVIVHAENGIVGLGPAPADGDVDPDVIDPGKSPATLVSGGAYIDHVDSFTIVRGRHLDVAVLGAFEVSVGGDIANWTSGGTPAVGGAMDLAVGARQVWVLMAHFAPDGSSKLVDRCSLPLTAPGVVTRIYTERGVFAPAGNGFDVLEVAPDAPGRLAAEVVGSGS